MPVKPDNSFRKSLMKGSEDSGFSITVKVTVRFTENIKRVTAIYKEQPEQISEWLSA